MRHKIIRQNWDAYYPGSAFNNREGLGTFVSTEYPEKSITKLPYNAIRVGEIIEIPETHPMFNFDLMWRDRDEYGMDVYDLRGIFKLLDIYFNL